MRKSSLVSTVLLFLFIASEDTYSQSNSAVTGYAPNSIALTGRSDDLDPSLRIDLSFKYIFDNVFGFESNEMQRAYFVYNGEFDFYWWGDGTRESAPVVGRVFNPALHFRRNIDADKWEDRIWTKWISKKFRPDYLDFSFNHRSNGQQVDAEERPMDGGGRPIEGENYTALTRYNEGDMVYIDSISRSSNYVQLETRFTRENHRTWLSAKAYASGEENLVTWRGEPFRASYSDYDRIKITYAYTHCPRTRFTFNWTVGDRWLATDSMQFEFQRNFQNVPLLRSLPFFVRVHTGPMETLSDHSRSVGYISAGLRFYNIKDRYPCK